MATANVTSASGSITFNSPVTLSANATVSANGGTVKFGSTVDNAVSACSFDGCDFTVNASTITLVGGIGQTSEFGTPRNVSLNAVNSLTLPSISAANIFAEATGAGSNLTLPAGAVLTASDVGSQVVVLGAANAFINNSGAGAIVLSGNVEAPTTWLIYSLEPLVDTFGGLDSNNTALWNTPVGDDIATTGNRYAFAFKPTLTFTPSDLSKTYGMDATSAVAADTVTISGLQLGVTGAFVGDTLASVYSGTPTVTSTGSIPTAGVGGYPIVVDVSGLVNGGIGYALAAGTPATLAVGPARLTITASDQTKTYGTALSLGTTAFTDAGLVNSDTVTGVTLTSAGAAATATVGGSPYLITPSAAVGTGLDNYTIAYVNAPAGLTVDPAALTIKASDQTKTYGTALALGTTAFTETGLVNSDTVTGVTLTSAGAAATATVVGSPYTTIRCRRAAVGNRARQLHRHLCSSPQSASRSIRRR